MPVSFDRFLLDPPQNRMKCLPKCRRSSPGVELGYCLHEDVLILHTQAELRASVLGACKTLAGLPLVEYGTTPEEGKKVIRHLSINRAKGLDAVAVIMVGTEAFQKISRTDNQYTYFMGESRAKQMRAAAWVKTSGHPQQQAPLTDAAPACTSDQLVSGFDFGQP